MTYVIIDACKDEKAAVCLDVCPVDCIIPITTQYIIDPNLCIDCGACETVCPVEAIYHEDDLLDEDQPSRIMAMNHFRS
ncbi:ferredoxin family protein [Psychrobacillus sp.]|uniref:indolepyruvate ferredoxin oxidoreductase subunit alpha n=1 Tax=Psychrobacillus sp. TaxID=1871623 RepID=UPI0028BD7F71|nr:ferredoxin family protein [Psychrobacillus sp.]